MESFRKLLLSSGTAGSWYPFAGGELSEEDQANFIKEMEALFLDAKEEAKKFTPKKYL